MPPVNRRHCRIIFATHDKKKDHKRGTDTGADAATAAFAAGDQFFLY